MAVRRSSSILCASGLVLVLALFKVELFSFIGSKAATRAPKVARFYESGNVDYVPLTGLATVNTGIMECLEADCSVEEFWSMVELTELTEREQQLAQHEQRISAAMADVKKSHLRNRLSNGFSIEKWF